MNATFGDIKTLWVLMARSVPCFEKAFFSDDRGTPWPGSPDMT